MAPLLDKRLILVTGKGGVGKSSVAAALGLLAARRGKRTIVCEVAQQERISSAFRREGVGHSETELRERLFAISLDPELTMKEYLRRQVRPALLHELLLDSRLFQYLAAATPGLRELLAMGKVWELAQLERRTAGAAPYDLVIVDAPASGHSVGMLQTPSTFREVARVGPIRRQADKIDAFVRDPEQTGVVAVALPEEMPVSETLELEATLRDELGVAVDVVVANGLYPERFSTAEAERIEQANGSHPVAAVRAALGAAAAEHHRARGQRAQLRRLRRGARAPVVTLPYLFEPELRLDSFERLAAELGRKL
ncbi:MAG: AAA family ATPase [Thermoleophilaceae bacterium]|nr:AAA family ATPase [Thermoleophilaceae bacterium]